LIKDKIKQSTFQVDGLSRMNFENSQSPSQKQNLQYYLSLLFYSKEEVKQIVFIRAILNGDKQISMRINIFVDYVRLRMLIFLV